MKSQRWFALWFLAGAVVGGGFLIGVAEPPVASAENPEADLLGILRAAL